MYIGQTLQTLQGPATVLKLKGQQWIKVEGLGKGWWQLPELMNLVHPVTFVESAPPTTNVEVVAPEWIPALPGTLKVGQPARLFAGGHSWTVVQVHGKAWVKLNCKPAWYKTQTLFIQNFHGIIPAAGQPTVKFQVDLGTFEPKQPGTGMGWTKYWTAVTAKLDGNQRMSLKSYTGAAYGELNKSLREGGSGSYHKSLIPHLDSAISLGAMPHDVTIWRAGSRKFDLTKPPGWEFVDHGYASCSTDKKFAENWGGTTAVLFVIRMRKGQRGLYIQTVSNHKHEYELILPRSTKYRVISIEKQLVKNKAAVVTVDVVEE